MPKGQDYSTLTILNQLMNKDVVGLFHNKIHKVVKKGKKDHWYLKEVDSKKIAVEILAQELLRLLIPNQPKYRPVTRDNKMTSYSISKEVKGYRSLGDIDETWLKNKIESGYYHGLGEVVAAALWVDESDLKLDNMCRDSEHQILKIDGDGCFDHLMWPDYHVHTVTANDIDNLPCPPKYMINPLTGETYKGEFNWLNGISLDEGIKKSAMVRSEINRTLLKIIAIPDETIKSFVNQYLNGSESSKPFIDEIIKRRNMLEDAAKGSALFCQYVLTDAARNDYDQFILRLRTFKTMGRDKLEVPHDGLFANVKYHELVKYVAEKNLKEIRDMMLEASLSNLNVGSPLSSNRYNI